MDSVRYYEIVLKLSKKSRNRTSASGKGYSIKDVIKNKKKTTTFKEKTKSKFLAYNGH